MSVKFRQFQEDGGRLPAIGALVFAIAEYAFATVVRITLSLSSVIVVKGIMNFEFKLIFNYTSMDLTSHTQDELEAA